MKNNKRECYFKANDIQEVDFKDVELLKKFLSTNLKIRPQRRTGLSSEFQRKVAKAIKRARKAGLIPYSSR